jgi:hypothetical protein
VKFNVEKIISELILTAIVKQFERQTKKPELREYVIIRSRRRTVPISWNRTPQIAMDQPPVIRHGRQALSA